jgi:hypothetical protein
LRSASTLSHPSHSAGGSLATPRLRAGAGLGDLALLAAEVEGSILAGRDEALVAALDGLEALVAGRDLVSAVRDDSRDLNVRSEPDVGRDLCSGSGLNPCRSAKPDGIGGRNGG